MNILFRQSGIPGKHHAGMKQKRKVASVKESVFDFIFNSDLSDWTDSDDDDDRKTTLLPYENPVCAYDNPVCACDLDVLPIGHQPLQICVECDVHAADLHGNARDSVGPASNKASPTGAQANCESLSPNNLDSLLSQRDSPVTVAEVPVNGPSGAEGDPTSGKCGERCLSAVQASQRSREAVLLQNTVPDSAPVSSKVTDLTISVSGAPAAARDQQQAAIVQEGLKVLEENERDFQAKAGDCVTVGPTGTFLDSSCPRRPDISVYGRTRESVGLTQDKCSNASSGLITNCNASQVSDHKTETPQTSPQEHQHDISHKALTKVDNFVNKQIHEPNYFYPECETSSTDLRSPHSVHLGIAPEKGAMRSQVHQLNVKSGTSSTLPAHYTKNSHRSGATYPTTGLTSPLTSVRAEDPARTSPPNSTAAERALSRTKSEPSKPVSTSQPHVLAKVTSPRHKGHGRSKSLDVFDHLEQVLDHLDSSGGATSKGGRKQRRASPTRRVFQRSRSLDATQHHEQMLYDADTEEAISEDQRPNTQARKRSLRSRVHEKPLTKSTTSSRKPSSVKASSFNDLEANLEGPDSSLKSAKSPKNSKPEQTLSSKTQSVKSETASKQETVIGSVKGSRQSAERTNDFTDKKEHNGKSVEPHAFQGVIETFEIGESAVESHRSKSHFHGLTIQSLHNSSSHSHSDKQNCLLSKKKNAETDHKGDKRKDGWLASLFSCPVIFGLKRNRHESSDNEQKKKKQTTLKVPSPIARLLGRVQSDSRLAEKAVFTVSGKKLSDGRGTSSEPTSPPVDMPADASSRRSTTLQLAVPQVTLRRRSADLDDDLKLLGDSRSGCGLRQFSFLDLAADVDASDAVSMTSSSPSTSSENSESGERGSMESESQMDSWMPRRKKLAKKLTTALSDEQALHFSALSESGKGSADRKPQVSRARHLSVTSESEAEACEAVEGSTAGRRTSSPGLQRTGLGSGPLPLSATRSSLLSSPASTGPGRSAQPPAPRRSSASLPAPGSSSGAGSKTGPVVRLSSMAACPGSRLLSVPNKSDIEPEPDLVMTTGMPRSRNSAQSLRGFGSEGDSPQSSRPETPSYVHANSIEGGALQTISACEWGADGVSPFQADDPRRLSLPGGLDRLAERPLGPLTLAISLARHPDSYASCQSHRHLQHHHVASRRASCSECQEQDSSWKGLFTARLFNRVGSKSVLRNVSHVSHVYKGTILITDMLASKILFSARSGRTVKEFLAHSGSEPYCACVTPRGHVAVTLRRAACVTVWSANGELVREFGQGVLQCPTGLTCDRRGQFIVTDERANRVSIFSPQGRFVRYLGYANDHDNNSDDSCRLDQHSPDDLSDDGDNNGIKLEAWKEASTRNSQDRRKATEQKVRFVSPATSAASDQHQEPEGPPAPAQRPSPSSPTNAPSQRTATAQKGDRTTGGESGASCEEGGKAGRDDSQPFIFNVPRYACVTGSGHIVVSDSGSNSVKVFSPEGNYLRSIGRYGSQDGCLRVPYGVCSDHDDHIFVADHYNNRVSVFSLEGDFLQHALTAQSGLVRPKSLAIRPAHVRLYVAHGELRSTEVLVFRLERGGRRISFKCDL